jgi:hypothetical protein
LIYEHEYPIHKKTTRERVFRIPGFFFVAANDLRTGAHLLPAGGNEAVSEY